ncbi:uncharacterized protein RSE6_12370 [Rhynchosporium secalis]|uniref:Uncharacterized protein n=1 Tax=Rhynchosporium secalis TaxID=38038 RepID=A0A1E1MQ89_RHYSE|nr:uncharacterized protein RSE6_12370 [Rhynchosporium secalis]
MSYVCSHKNIKDGIPHTIPLCRVRNLHEMTLPFQLCSRILPGSPFWTIEEKKQSFIHVQIQGGSLLMYSGSWYQDICFELKIYFDVPVVFGRAQSKLALSIIPIDTKKKSPIKARLESLYEEY